jgi:hypothetical protein
MLSGNGGKMKNMMPLATNLMGMGTGMQGQNQQPSDYFFIQETRSPSNKLRKCTP